MRTVIVGAGIAGLSAAKGRRLLGWDMEVYEQAPELKPLGAGLSPSANALRALQTLGLLEAVIAEAQPIHRVDLLDEKGGLLQSTDFRRFDPKYGHPSMVVIHWRSPHRALLSGCQGRPSAWGWRACMLGRPATVPFSPSQRERPSKQSLSWLATVSIRPSGTPSSHNLTRGSRDTLAGAR
jgi:2-polyprenyl-6-methoxyphenol hydroxylase-like FAD-dependent oxidoreductase